MLSKNMYKGNRYVPKIMGVWDSKTEYESLSVVMWRGASYTSKRNVPKGVSTDNETYWALTGNYNAQVEMYRKEVKKYANDVKCYIEEVVQARGKFKWLKDRFISIENSIKGIYTYIATNEGLVGDGKVDDSKAYMDLLKKAKDGESIFFPKGVYRLSAVTESIAPARGVKLIGAGRGVTVLDARLSKPFMILMDKEYTEVRHMSILKAIPTINDPTAGNNPPLYFHGGIDKSYGCVVDDVYVEGGASCIRIDAGTPSNGRITNSIFISSTDALDGTCIHGRRGVNFNISDNICYGGTGASSINLYGMSSSTVENNIAIDNKFAGCELEDNVGGNTVRGNKFLNCRNGVMIDDSRNNIVADNIIITDKVLPNKEGYGIWFSSKSLPDGSVWTENNIVNDNLIVGYYNWFGITPLSSPLHVNSKIIDTILRDNTVLGCPNGFINGDLDRVKGVLIEGNKIDFKGSIHPTSENGVYIMPKAMGVTVKDNTIVGYNYNIRVYDNPDPNIILDGNRCYKGVTADIECSQSNFKGKLINNITDKPIKINETVIFTGGVAFGMGNHSMDGGVNPNNNTDSLYGSAPTRRAYKNTSANTITKGSIVSLDVGYVWATNINVNSGTNYPAVVGVAMEDIETGKWGQVAINGRVEVLMSTAITNTLISKGTQLTDNNGVAVAVKTTDRPLLISLESKPLSDTSTTLHKAMFVLR